MYIFYSLEVFTASLQLSPPRGSFFVVVVVLSFVNTHKVHSLFLNCLWRSESSQTGQPGRAAAACGHRAAPAPLCRLPATRCQPRGGSAPSRGGAGLALEALTEELLSPGAPALNISLPPRQAQEASVQARLKLRGKTEAVHLGSQTKPIDQTSSAFCSQSDNPHRSPHNPTGARLPSEERIARGRPGGSPGGSLESWLQKYARRRKLASSTRRAGPPRVPHLCGVPGFTGSCRPSSLPVLPLPQTPSARS